MMKKWIFSIIAFVLAIAPACIKAQDTDREGINTIKRLPNGVVLIENFEDVKPGNLPQDWYNQKGSARPATYTGDLRDTYNYYVVEEGENKFLRYSGTVAKHLNFPLVNKPINIYKTPILSWQWRVKNLPEGANESDDDTNDTAASIYVVFGLDNILWKEVPNIIRYTWSSTLPVGTVESELFGHQKIVVVESGPEKMGKWITFKRNIVEDYKALFDEAPPKSPLAILILSDGDSTGSKAVAAYDNIKLLPENKGD